LSSRVTYNIVRQKGIPNVLVCFSCLQNFLFKSTKEDSPLKATDFGLSDFIRPGVFLIYYYMAFPV